MSNSISKPNAIVQIQTQTRPISPCRGLCGYADKDYCQGCFRTPDEISNWFYMPDDEKRRVIARVTPLIEASIKDL